MKKKSILCMFLTAVMLLSSLPIGTLSDTNSVNPLEISAFADDLDSEENSSEPANEDSVLSAAACEISLPIAGETPDMYPKVSAEAAYTVNFIGWYDSESPAEALNADDTFEAGKKYTVRIQFIPKDGYKFSNTLFFINNDEAKNVRDNIIETDFRALSRTTAVYFYVTPPVPDNPPDSSVEVYCAENDELYTASVIWFDAEKERMLTLGDVFENGHNYRAEISFEPTYLHDYNPEIVKNASWYVNNSKVDTPSENKLVLTKYFYANIVYINNVQMNIDVPTADLTPDMQPDNFDDLKYTAAVEKWYMPAEPDTIIDENYVFEANKEYTVQIKLTPNPGYAFVEDKISAVRVKINDKTAEYCGDYVWQITLTAMEHFKEIRFNIDKPISGDKVSERVEITPPSVGKLFDVTVKWYDLHEKKNVKVSDYYGDNKKYDLIITCTLAAGYTNFDTKLLEGTQWYINDDVLENEPEKYYHEYRLVKSFTTNESAEIEVADCIINQPYAGRSCIKDAVSSEPEKYDVSILSWTDAQNGGSSLTSLSKYQLKNTYTVNVQFTPKSGYKFGSKTKFKINGESSDGGGYTASTGEGAVWKAYYVSKTLVDTVKFTITAPTDGQTVSFDTDDTSDQYKAELTWYHGDKKLGSKDKFTEGEEYTAKLILTPEEEFRFGSESVVTINGQQAEYSPDTTTEKSVYSVKFVAEKNNTITVKVMMGDVDGGDNITSADSLLILRRSVGLENFTKTQDYIADVDGDGKISSADSLAVLRYSVKLPADGNVGQIVTVEEI